MLKLAVLSTKKTQTLHFMGFTYTDGLGGEEPHFNVEIMCI